MRGQFSRILLGLRLVLYLLFRLFRPSLLFFQILLLRGEIGVHVELPSIVWYAFSPATTPTITPTAASGVIGLVGVVAVFRDIELLHLLPTNQRYLRSSSSTANSTAIRSVIIVVVSYAHFPLAAYSRQLQAIT